MNFFEIKSLFLPDICRRRERRLGRGDAGCREARSPAEPGAVCGLPQTVRDEGPDRRARGAERRALASTVPSQVIAACGLTGAQRLLIEEMARMHQLSGRGIIRVLRVARTIADLGGEQTVSDDCLLEALMFRGVGGLE